MNEQIKRQAERDAIDAFNGHRVWNPYPVGSEAAEVWSLAFNEKRAELEALND